MGILWINQIVFNRHIFLIEHVNYIVRAVSTEKW